MYEQEKVRLLQCLQGIIKAIAISRKKDIDSRGVK